MKRILSTLLTFALIAGCCGCRRSGGDSDNTRTARETKTTTAKTTTTTEVTEATEATEETEEPSTKATTKPTKDDRGTTDPSDSDASDPSKSDNSGTPGTITDMTMLIFDFPQKELTDDNEIREIIAEKTGVRVHESYLTGSTAEDGVDVLIASREFPDLISAGSGTQKLYQENCLIPWDDYLEDPQYANLRNFYSDKEWEMFRQSDGHIYWCNTQNNNYKGKSASRTHNGLAFWIQVRVLEWAGYPLVETLDDYFTLLEAFYKANPTNEDGTAVIPYTALCESWRYYAIEAAPQMLDGHMFEGNVMVNDINPDHPVVESYDTSETAKRYLQKLNDEYKKGIIDPEFADQDFDQYVEKLQTGAVLGLCDQWWDFAYTTNFSFEAQGFSKLGYDYVPLGITIDSGMKNHWDYYADTETLNTASGVAVTTSCKNPDLAFQFMDRILEEDIHDLRMWGIEGVDYEIGADGIWSRNQDMRIQWIMDDYLTSHACRYLYLPNYCGYREDGINPRRPEDSVSEFFSNKSDAFIKCCNAYGYTSYRDFLRSEPAETGPWYPMYVYTNSLTNASAVSTLTDIDNLKHEYLPKLVTSDDFDTTWKKYVKAYIGLSPEVYFDYMQKKLDEAVKNAG
ncbi:MAG: sugar ABC transporter substrate-binding protein [Clostridiales bacterium]|nr:sugar ABC transporter substrate-binding protein [Clostridiales bacterium]